MPENAPVFVRGYSRSGGTLLVTILDAHPDLAMSYELYPNLLESESGSIDDLEAVVNLLTKAKSVKQAGRKIKEKSLRTFVLRCDRGGLDNRELAELLELHLGEGLDFSSSERRLRFIEKCCVKKMKKAGKSRWGLKCNNRYKNYLAVWPDAFFLNILRDGRDVLASQLHTGSFNKTPEEIGKGWARTFLLFQALQNQPGVNARQISYERLVTNPREEVSLMCDFLRMPFCESMLDFSKKDLTIFSASHLSMDRISKPIDTSRIGRWKKNVSEDQLGRFLSTAKEAMIQTGYITDETC